MLKPHCLFKLFVWKPEKIFSIHRMKSNRKFTSILSVNQFFKHIYILNYFKFLSWHSEVWNFVKRKKASHRLWRFHDNFFWCHDISRLIESGWGMVVGRFPSLHLSVRRGGEGVGGHIKAPLAKLNLKTRSHSS